MQNVIQWTMWSTQNARQFWWLFNEENHCKRKRTMSQILKLILLFIYFFLKNVITMSLHIHSITQIFFFPRANLFGRHKPSSKLLTYVRSLSPGIPKYDSVRLVHSHSHRHTHIQARKNPFSNSLHQLTLTLNTSHSHSKNKNL